VGFINAAEHAVERQRLDDALMFTRRAQTRAPHSEAVLQELSHLYSLCDSDTFSISYADTLCSFFPRKAASHVQKSDARFFTNGNADSSIEILSDAIPTVDSTEQQPLRQALGMSLWYRGRYTEAAEQFREILRQVPDDPNALWGLGLSLGDSGLTVASDSVFRKALLLRNGIVELRLDYARMLLSAGKLEDAAAQLEEAQLLARGDPILITLKAWLNAEYGSWKEALRLLDRALEIAPNQRLAAVLRLRVMQHYQPPKRRDARKRNPLKREMEILREQGKTDIPQWEFLARKSAYIPSRTWPQFQRNLLKQYSGG
jgi:Flp pilus assembly protein TadD